MQQPRASTHVEPHGTIAVIRHYLRDLVYGAIDGIITTFAVVAGVAGGELSSTAALVVGAANLAADGLSMGVGNFLSIRAHESARAADNLPEEERHPLKHAGATFMAFVAAGILPMLPYVQGGDGSSAFGWSILLTGAALFGVGAARGRVTADTWWRTGVEMLLLGALVAAAAYGAGAIVAHWVRGMP